MLEELYNHIHVLHSSYCLTVRKTQSLQVDQGVMPSKAGWHVDPGTS